MAKTAEPADEKTTMQMPKFTVTLIGEKPFTVFVSNGAQAQWEIERRRKDYPTTDEAPNLWATYVTWASAKRDPAIKSVPSSMPFEAYMESVEVIGFDDPVDADPSTADHESA